jgi:hypothetical protein
MRWALFIWFLFCVTTLTFYTFTGTAPWAHVPDGTIRELLLLVFYVLGLAGFPYVHIYK